MFEAVIALSIILLAIIFYASFVGNPVIKVTSSSSQLKVFGDDILRSLDEYTSEVGGSYHNSFLVQCIIEKDVDALTNRLNQSLPKTALYNIYVYNGVTQQTELWYPETPIPNVENVVKSSRAFVYNGFVYEVQLEVWYV